MKDKISLLHISTFENGGAAKAMFSIHNNLNDENIQSEVLVLKKTSSNPKVQDFLKGRSFKTKVIHSINARVINFILKAYRFLFKIPKSEDINFNISPYDVLKHPAVQKADIIHLHWTQGFVSFYSFMRKINKPVLITLQDEHLMLGVFHYEYDLKKHRKLLQNIDHSISVRKRKIIFNKKTIKIIGPSSWLTQRAYKFLRTENSIVNLPCFTDTTTFHPKKSPSILANDTAIKVLFIAESIFIERKGFKYLKELISTKHPRLQFTIIGSGGEHFDGYNNVNYKGYIKDPNSLRLEYNKADFLFMPSLADNLPNTILESLACGTPVICFATTGMIDLVEDSVNGIHIQQPFNPAQVINRIIEVKDQERLFAEMKNSSVEKINNYFHKSVVIDRYQTILKELIIN